MMTGLALSNTFFMVIPTAIAGLTKGSNCSIGVAKNIRKLKKEETINITEAYEANQFTKNRNKISDKFYADIERMSKGNSIVLGHFVSKALETNHWIKFAIYYMTDHNAILLNYADKKAKELVNSIAKLAGFDKIYINENIADIDAFDSKNLNFNYSGCFLLNKDELIDFLSNPQFIAAVKTKIEMVNHHNNIIEGRFITTTKDEEVVDVNNEEVADVNKEEETVEENTTKTLFGVPIVDDDVIQPISFTSIDDNKEKPPVPKRGEGVPVDVFVKFENVFEKFIPELVPYHYEFVDGFYVLYITRTNTGVEEFYILDDGSIMGGSSVSILANYVKDGVERTMFVNVLKHPAIASKVLTRTLFNYLTPEEVEECKTDYLQNMVIYNSIYFANTDFFDNLSDKDKFDFEVNLLGVINLEIAKNVRLRFESFTDAHHFVLTSDYNNMKRPLKYIQDTPMPETYILDGLRIAVDGCYILTEYNGEVKRYRMG